MEQRFFLQQIQLHDNFQMRDALKLCFQASFGAEHLLEDEETARVYLYREYMKTPQRDEPLYEQIARDVFRVNIGAWKARNLPIEWLHRLFVASAKNHTANLDAADAQQTFLVRLELIDAMCQQGKLPFRRDAWELFKDNYLSNGIRAVHHSDIYRDTNRPAYRVVSGPMCRMLPIFEKLEAKAPFVIVIDGRCASGKTTLAENLCHVLDVDAVHMDDFFLPPELRTQARLTQAGGNVHYERFAKEVLPHLNHTDAFSYQRFDCSKMEMGNMVSIGEGNIRVVEGSYSAHTFFGDYADLRVFCDVEPHKQMERIITRDGKDYAEVFRKNWIPMEEAYFDAMQIREKAELVL